MMALVIAGREFRNLFLSPLAWTMLAVLQFILSFMFLAQLDYYLMLQPRLEGLDDAPGVTDAIVAPLFGNAGVILMLVTPLLTLRLVSEERRNRTLSLLFTAPISMTEIIVGKYLGVLAFLFVVIGMLTLMPLSLYLGGSLDTGKLLANVLALSSWFPPMPRWGFLCPRSPIIQRLPRFRALERFFCSGYWTGPASRVRRSGAFFSTFPCCVITRACFGVS